MTIIPRKILFGNPDKTGVQISPDGKYIAYIAPLNGVLNVYVAPIDKLNNAQAVTDDKGRGIRVYYWSYDNIHLLYLQDNNGDENWHLYGVNIKSLEKRSFTDFTGTRVQVNNASPRFPNEIIIEINNRRQDFFDLYKLDLKSGKLTEIFQNNEFSSVIIDDYFNLRFAQKLNTDGSLSIYQFDKNLQLSLFMDISAEDIYTTAIVDFNEDNNSIYMIDSVNRNTAALVLLDQNTRQKKLIYENNKADISSIMLHPTKKYLQAASYNYLRKENKIFDAAMQQSLTNINKFITGELVICSRSLDDQIWIVADFKDDSPVTYYKYDRATNKMDFLFYNRKDLLGYQLTKMHPIVITASDGLEMVSYLSLPINVKFDPESCTSDRSVPLVLWVHGGPTARDTWGYDAVHQWLTNRGYGVLSVNYRGSTGFGKAFINAGDGQWSRKMHTDLIDTVNWMIEKGITSKETVAIGGGSYGGYAALVGLTFTPDVFKCAIDIVGPSNLETLLATIPPYWKPHVVALEKKLGGNLNTEAGREELKLRSPITFVDNISKPLLIGQGANDPRVKQAESDQIVSLMNQKGIPVTYVLYPEEGHGFAKPENRMSFYAITELFLKNHLGGAYEEYGTDLDNANFQILAGKIK